MPSRNPTAHVETDMCMECVHLVQTAVVGACIAAPIMWSRAKTPPPAPLQPLDERGAWHSWSIRPDSPKE